MQNRNKLIGLFIGNLANAIVHAILEEAIDRKEIADRYRKEWKTSKDIAVAYRKKINPAEFPLPSTDVEHIRAKLRKRINSELKSRIARGYQNINLERIDILIEKYLKECRIL